MAALCPKDINTDRPFLPAVFCDRDATLAAHTLVVLAQRKGGWKRFRIEEADQLLASPFLFHGLASGRNPLIRSNSDGTYAFTKEFIRLCAQAVPPPPRVDVCGRRVLKNNSDLFPEED